METKSTKTIDHYFCSATIRPSECLKATALCCLHCDEVVKCLTFKHKGTKPCTFDIITFEEECEYSI